MRILFPGLLICAMSASLLAQQQPTTAELKKDIEALQASLAAIQKELQDIKALLQQGRPAAAPVNLDLDLANYPFKGERTAKLTLVEFSDYQ